jgi:hypothetical protein
MAQKTAWTGAALTESDINTYLMGEGGAWTSWTPTCTQSGSVAVTNTRSRYARYGRMIVATFNLEATAAGSAGNGVIISLPVTAASVSSIQGVGYILDGGTGYYVGVWTAYSTTAVQLIAHAQTGAVGGTPSFALASGDFISGTITYEASS